MGPSGPKKRVHIYTYKSQLNHSLPNEPAALRTISGGYEAILKNVTLC